MDNILVYKGYHAIVEYDSQDKVLFGKIQFIDDLITFESDSAANIENEFHAAVDDYIETCAEIGKEPQKPFKGSFNVRTSPEIHKQISVVALHRGITINQFVCEALEEKLEGLVHHQDLVNSEVRLMESISSSTDALWHNTANLFFVTKKLEEVRQ